MIKDYGAGRMHSTVLLVAETMLAGHNLKKENDIKEAQALLCYS